MDLYRVLSELDIHYEEVSHPPVYTVSEAHALGRLLSGTDCKNLFLCDSKKKRFFLAVYPAQKLVNLKSLSSTLGVKGLHFASPTDLDSILGLIPGSVTPLGIINDAEHRVEVLLDADLVGQTVLVHPNTNSKTISISFDDLIRFITHLNHLWQVI